MSSNSNDLPDLSSAIASVHLICVDGHGNHNKFWQGYVLPNGILYAKYGRVNYQGQTHSYHCGSVAKAQTKLRQLLKEKCAKGYTEVELERAANQTLNLTVLGDPCSICEAARAEDIKAQIHQLEVDAAIVHQHTNIRFDPEKGQYRTELGIITVQTIERAQTVLDQVLYAQSSLNRTSLIQAIEAYLRLIPLPVGMSLNPEALLGSYAQIQNQRMVLQTLQEGIDRISQIRTQIRQVIQSDQYMVQTERSFWITWGEEISEVQNALNDTRSDCISWE